MALKINKRMKFGVEADYWKIFDVHYDFHNQRCEITIVPFIDEELRISSMPIKEEALFFLIESREGNQNFSNYFSPEALDNNKENIVAASYRYLKEVTEEFQGAEDC